MADAEHILTVLREFWQAYPRQHVGKETAELYVHFLADIPNDLLREAAAHHIATSIFFPTIAELRSLAARLEGTSRTDNPASATTALPEALEWEALVWQAQVLEDAFFEQRTLDPVEWEQLAERFEQADCPHRAEHTRKKVAALQAILEQELDLEVYNSSIAAPS